MDLFRKKSLTAVIAEAGDPNVDHGHPGSLSRQLDATNLTLLGIGAIIGAGIFTVTGEAAANHAGPGIVYSFLIGGVLCALAGLCYAELAAMIPIAGSAYTYTYTTMGETLAWIIGWDLVLEYAFGAVAVCIAWSGYAMSLLQKTLGITLPDWVMRFTAGPWSDAGVVLADGTKVGGYWNVPASSIAIIASIVLYRGIKESAWVNNIIVAVKLLIVCSFIALGFGVISTGNLQVNPDASGLASLVPVAEHAVIRGETITRFGWGLGGVLTAAGTVFFSYIGFDAVSTAAQETKNPKRDLPIGILASLLICTTLYIAFAIVLTGVVNYRELAVPDPVAVGVDRIVMLRHWSPAARGIFSFAVKVGALAGLTSVILVLMLGQTRIFYAMARDGLLPFFARTHERFHTPHVGTVVTGIAVLIGAGLVPIEKVVNLVSIGTLLAFVLVCIGVPILRVTNPDAPRSFKAPLPWLVGPLGALACMWVMIGLPGETWLRLAVWLVIGFGVYFGYGRRHSRLAAKHASEAIGRNAA